MTRSLLFVGLALQQMVLGQEPKNRVLERADQLFWLDNWVSARTLFAEAEAHAKRNGDKRNELYARISRLRADAERESYVSVLAILDAEKANPLLSADLLLRLRYYAVRGAMYMSVNPEDARADWGQVLAAAKLIASEAWLGRAKGELSICSFLAGDYAEAKALSDEALAIASSTGDVASEVRQRSLKGVALLQQRRYDEAEVLIDRAISLAEGTPNIRFPIMAYMAKSEILTIRGAPKSGTALIERLQEYLKTVSATVYLPDLYLELAQRASRTGDSFEARRLYERAARPLRALACHAPTRPRNSIWLGLRTQPAIMRRRTCI